MERSENNVGVTHHATRLCLLQSVLESLVNEKQVSIDSYAAEFPDLPRLEQDIGRVTSSFEAFRNWGHFHPRRVLGIGATGIVFECCESRNPHESPDESGLERVAVKHLFQNASVLDGYNFKNEFRLCERILHENLVRIISLVTKHSGYFIVMELIEGTCLDDYILEQRSDGRDTKASDPGQTTVNLPDDSTTSYLVPTNRSTRMHEQRMRDAFRQLARGVHYLHSMNIVHCDLKPSNILVSQQGRVVIVDFGLAVVKNETAINQLALADQISVAGTIPYMSPEQAAGQRYPGEASDWYSVGVALFQVLTGQLPFAGDARTILKLKQTQDAPLVQTFQPGVPYDLAELCNQLLQRDPEKRPSGSEVVNRLSKSTNPLNLPETNNSSGTRAESENLIGRARELEELMQAFAVIRESHESKTDIGARVVFVRGQSGIGKTTLLNKFHGAVRRSGGYVVEGRCYDGEIVPFPGVDSLVDALSNCLRASDGREVERLHLHFRKELTALVRMFPILRRVPQVAKLQTELDCNLDQVALKELATKALRELFRQLAIDHPLVLSIDDMQWADFDSMELIYELLCGSEHPPNILFTLWYRSDDSSSIDRLRLPLRRQSEIEVREMELQSLSHEHSLRLAASLLESNLKLDRDLAVNIANESHGNPLFIHILANGGLGTTKESIHDVIWQRISRLPANAQRILIAVSVAAMPLNRQATREVAMMDQELTNILASLRASNLIKYVGQSEEKRLEPFHAEIREAILSRCEPPRLRSIHGQLASALENVDSDAALIAFHYAQAGQINRACEYYEKAALNAYNALAFESSATHFRRARALSKQPWDTAKLERLSDAVANAGHAFEAAQTYLEAAKGGSGMEQIELQRRAMMQYLISGHSKEGANVLDAVLKAIRLYVPQGEYMTLFAWLAMRISLKLFIVRPWNRQTQIACLRISNLTIQMEVCWSAAIGYMSVNPVRAMYFQALNLRFAYKTGDIRRICRANYLDIFQMVLTGMRAKKRCERLLIETDELKKDLNDGYLNGLSALAAGEIKYWTGQSFEAISYFTNAENLLRGRCRDVSWELDTVEFYRLWALYLSGQLLELIRRLPAIHKAAIERQNLYLASAVVSPAGVIAWLALGKPKEARQELQSLTLNFSPDGLQALFSVMGQVQIDIYEKKGNVALERMSSSWRSAQGPLLRKVEGIRVFVRYLRACTVMCAVSTGESPIELLRIAERDARSLTREKADWVKPQAALIMGGIQILRSDFESAKASLSFAEREFRKWRQELFANAVQWHLGTITGGVEGDGLIKNSVDWMRNQRIKEPEQIAYLILPTKVNPTANEC